MNAKISVFVICDEAIIYLLLYNLRYCTFKWLSFPIKVLPLELKSFPHLGDGPQQFLGSYKVKNYYCCFLKPQYI